MIPHTLVALVLVPLLGGILSTDQPPELGRVRFGRDVDRALARARTEKKPVFLLFQEIPGCATCKSFGEGPLTDPLLVEAIETLFVPVVVHNNAGGDDARALERFGESAWNNPVVRWLGADGRDLIPREEGVWSTAAIATRMTQALEKSGTSAPEWLKLAQRELDTATQSRIVLGMHCFWEGQARLGALPGVVDARPGFVDGIEVVDVRFVPGVTSLADLVRRADLEGCAAHVFATSKEALESARSIVLERAVLLSGPVRDAGSNDDLRALKASPAFRDLKLTRAQSVRVNALLSSSGGDPKSVLSPRQLEELKAIEARLAR